MRDVSCMLQSYLYCVTLFYENRWSSMGVGLRVTCVVLRDAA